MLRGLRFPRSPLRLERPTGFEPATSSLGSCSEAPETSRRLPVVASVKDLPHAPGISRRYGRIHGRTTAAIRPTTNVKETTR